MCADYVMNIKLYVQIMLWILNKMRKLCFEYWENAQIILWILNKMCRLRYELWTKYADYVMNIKQNAQIKLWIMN